MSSKKSKDEPEQDPYEVLGVEFDASDAAISKAYKKLALKLHPDKQTKLGPSEAEEVAKQFHDVQQARAFLLDPEHEEARRKYDAMRASILQREKADAKRQESMSNLRKRQIQELRQREADAERSKNKKKPRFSKSKSKGKDDELIDKLREENRKLRENAARKKAEAAEAAARVKAKSQKQDRKQRERLLQNRQVRLKWSRKKIETSPSEHGLATLLSRFGTVEEVEMIGSKGNMANITFEFPSACRSCVDFYKKSEEMRAFFVGKRKEEEEAREAAAEQVEEEQERSRSKQSHDQESLYDRKMRQAAEREQLLRQMEVEESGEQTQSRRDEARESTDVSSRCVSVNFPSNLKDLTPIERLEKVEEDILGKILPGDAMARLQELHA